MLAAGCHPARYVPEGNYLLSSNKVFLDTRVLNKKDIQGFIRQKPNKRVLGFRFHLGLYNMSDPQKDNWWNRWLRNIGEAPTVLDEFQVTRSTDLITKYLRNKGYYNARVDQTIFFKHREAEISYSVRSGEPYIIGRISYLVEDTALNRFVLPDTVNSLLKTSMNFDVDAMEMERQRIESLLKNHGYFNFSKEFVIYQADTTVGNLKTDITLNIKKYLPPPGTGPAAFVSHPKYQLGQVHFISDQGLSDPGSDQTALADTVRFDSLYFISKGKFPVKPQLLTQVNFMREGQIFRQGNADNTYRRLQMLRVFKFIDFQYSETGRKDSASQLNLLNCDILLYPQVMQSYATELEGTNSSGNVGIAGNLAYQNKNLFRGAEIFDAKVKGAIETYSRQKISELKSTVEFGVEGSLKIPRFWLPFRTEQFVRKYGPKTTFNIAYNYQRRPPFTRTITTASFGYTWQGNKYLTHIVKPIELNAVKIFSIKPEFQAEIAGKPYLENSYQDHFISTSSYALIFNNQNLRKNNNFFFFRMNLESAGSLLQAINSSAGSQTYSSGSDSLNSYYELFGTRYSQFVRGEFDIRFNQMLNETDRLVYRFYTGLGLPYGNSNALPFEKRFFSGGSNGLRAWQVRSLGPGSYSEPDSVYPNSMADVKLEMNLEYRFKLFWIMEGALFVDAGNIWSINSFDNRAGAIFHLDSFMKDIAIGTGLGTRFDFSFFIFRLDVGMKTRDPSLDKGKKWIPLNRAPVKDDFVVNIGIGYPF
jgi:outer membrane protein assembly factor BamA